MRRLIADAVLSPLAVTLVFLTRTLYSHVFVSRWLMRENSFRNWSGVELQGFSQQLQKWPAGSRALYVHPLKVFVFATDRLRLLFSLSDSIYGKDSYRDSSTLFFVRILFEQPLTTATNFIYRNNFIFVKKKSQFIFTLFQQWPTLNSLLLWYFYIWRGELMVHQRKTRKILLSFICF